MATFDGKIAIKFTSTVYARLYLVIYHQKLMRLPTVKVHRSILHTECVCNGGGGRGGNFFSLSLSPWIKPVERYFSSVL